MNFKLLDLSTELKKLLSIILIMLMIAIALGLFFVTLEVGTSQKDLIEHYNGNDKSSDEFELNYGKSLKALTLTVHNHVLSFTLVFSLLTLLFTGVNSVGKRLKSVLLIEPFLSILTTFGSMYLIRFVHPSFVYLIIFSSTLLYFSFYLMSILCLRELFKK